MEELVELSKPIFSQEQALLKWVAIRGALPSLAELGVALGDSIAAESVGLRWDDPGGGFRVAESELPSRVAEAAVGLASSIFAKAVDYAEISQLSSEQVLSDQRGRLAAVSNELALEYIVWCAIVLNRLEARGFVPPAPATPEPSELEMPGWYVDPLFGQAARYWDGSDWTNRTRLPPSHPRFKELPAEFLSPI